VVDRWDEPVARFHRNAQWLNQIIVHFVHVPAYLADQVVMPGAAEELEMPDATA
jgi:hypothetical protein